MHYTRSSPPLRFLYIMGSPLDLTPDQGAEDMGLYTPSGACAYTGADEVAGIGLLQQMGPRLGPVAGGTNVTILGAYFMTLDDDALRRVFPLTLTRTRTRTRTRTWTRTRTRTLTPTLTLTLTLALTRTLTPSRCVFGAQQVNATIISFEEQRCFSPPLEARTSLHS